MLWIVLGACGSAPLNTGWETYRGGDAFARARALEKIGDKDEARLAYRSIRRDHPGNTAAFLKEIELTTEPDEISRLATELEGLTSAASRTDLRSRFLALHSRLSKDPRRIAELADEALSLNPENALAHASRAELFERRGSDKDALIHWAKAAAAPSPPPFVFESHAAALIRGHDYDGAINALRNRVALAPDDWRSAFNLGTLILDHSGRPGDAVKYLKAAYELAPDDLDLMLNYASAVILGGNNVEGARLLERARRLNPEVPEVYFNLGVYWADHANDSEKALASFKKYLALGGEDTMRVGRWVQELGGESER